VGQKHIAKPHASRLWRLNLANPQTEIPYGCYWSTPFTKWQGALQHLNSLEFASWVCRRELERRDIEPSLVNHAVLGTTVIQHHGFYGLPWLTGMAGLPTVTGHTLTQACATGVRLLLAGMQEISSGLASTSLVVAADRTSNGPHVYYPEPSGPGGTGTHEDWVLDNFSCDPLGGHSMLQTAENVARKHSVSADEQHAVTLRRLEQYQDALKDNNAFQRRYMTLPFEVPRRDLKKIERTINGDEGVYASTAEGMSRLKPVMPGGSVTFAGQTHPADGNAALIVTDEQVARSISKDPGIRIQAVGFGQARVELAHMPEATVPAARGALAQAGISVQDLHAVKTHNPFAVNDVVLSRALGYPIDKMNNFGCSLIWGHPQGPTGLRSIIELIEELVLRGGGYGLFTGCAAGDTGLSVVIRVSERP
jgi:acetyl-CoA acetyltransferase